MPNYELNRLGDKEFERMCQSLLKEVIGDGTITFGDGPDGGREAIFNGSASYPSETDRWSGRWIFQVKFHNIELIGAEIARKQIIADLKSELEKITEKYKLLCENYILITNVPLSSVSGRGTHDRIDNEVISKYIHKIPHIHIWGSDEICRFLEKYSGIRQAYLHFLTPGDLIATLMNKYSYNETVEDLATTMKIYLNSCFKNEQYAQLDQAGKMDEEEINLKNVFIDLNVTARKDDDKYILYEQLKAKHFSLSAMELLLSEKLLKIVIIGGPGEGKSTLGQYLAQIHRATLLNRLNELKSDKESSFNLIPLEPRIPFRILLKDYAQWLAKGDRERIFEYYLIERIQKFTGRELSPKNLQQILQKNPCLLVLDGLDEVPDQKLRFAMLNRIVDFIDRCDHALNEKLQVIATTRPMGYTDQFDPEKFVHLQLTKLEPAKIYEYVLKWSHAKKLDDEKSQKLLDTIKECFDDQHIRFLMGTPLQVSILILIVLIEGTPPKQREELFNEYLEIIYRREKAKTKTIIQTKKNLLFGLHEYLGYILQSRSLNAQDVGSFLKKPEFISHVRTFLSFKNPQWDSVMLDQQTDLIVKEANERLVLIVGLQDERYGFELRSIQEFFAAAHLENAKSSQQRYERFEAISRSTHWRNVTLFFAGRVGRMHSAEAANLLEICRNVDRYKPDKFLRRGEKLALELAVDQSFSTDGRLQWSAIEYSLSYISIEQQRASTEISDIIKNLPDDDIRDHVIPFLKNKLFSLTLPYLENALDLYNIFEPHGEPLLEILDRLIRSSQQQNVVFAIKKSMDFLIDPNWLAPRLEQHIDSLSLSIFLDIFADKCLIEPNYIQRCLSHCLVSEEKLEALIEHMFLKEDDFSFFRTSTSNYSNFSILEINNLKDLFFIMFQVLKVVREEKILVTDEEQIGQEIVDGIHFLDIHPSYKKANTEIFAKIKDASAYFDKINLNNIPQSNCFLFLSEMCRWIYLFVSSDKLSNLIEPFAEFYRDIKLMYPWAGIFFERYCDIVYPFLPLLIDLIDLDSHFSIEDVKYLSVKIEENQSDENVFWDKLSTFLIRQRKFLTRDELVTLLLAGQISNQEKAEKVQNRLRKIYNIDLKTLSILLSKMLSLTIAPAPNAIGSKTICIVLNEIYTYTDNELELKLQRDTIRSLSWFKWKVDDQAFFKVIELLEKMLQKRDFGSPILGSSMLILLIKMIDSGYYQDDIAISVIKRIGQIDDKLSNYFEKIRLFELNKPLNALKRLKDLLADLDTEVAHGAIVLMDVIIDSSLKSGFMKKNMKKGYFDILFKPDAILRMIENGNSKLTVVSIKLLAFTSLSIENEYGRLLSSILECRNDNEANAWCYFIENTQFDPLLKWLELLEDLLNRKNQLKPIVVDAVVRIYSKLITSKKSEDFFDEKVLGLPLDLSSL